MDKSSIRIEALRADSDPSTVEAARTLLLEYGRFVLDTEGPARFCFGKLEEEAAQLPSSFTSPDCEPDGGPKNEPDGESNEESARQLLLAWVDGHAAGCVTSRAMPSIAGACEMKRLWVRPEFRGIGLGEQLVLALLERARRAGCTAVYLDTVPANMASAYRMYLRLGFEACPPYHASLMEGLAFLRRVLDSESR